MNTRNPFVHVWKTVSYTAWMLRQRGWVEYEPCENPDCEGCPDEREHWGYKNVWRLRPKFEGFYRQQPCGCTTRFGKIKLYRYRCPELHGNLNKRLAEREARG